jgi:hypothetical protein
LFSVIIPITKLFIWLLVSFWVNGYYSVYGLFFLFGFGDAWDYAIFTISNLPFPSQKKKESKLYVGVQDREFMSIFLNKLVGFLGY